MAIKWTKEDVIKAYQQVIMPEQQQVSVMDRLRQALSGIQKPLGGNGKGESLEGLNGNRRITA